MSSPFVPGPCGPLGCPPPTELVCIKTKKVFQECRHSFVPNSIPFDLTIAGITPLPIATGVTCGNVFVEPSFNCGPNSTPVPCTPGPVGGAPVLPIPQTVCPTCRPCTTGIPLTLLGVPPTIPPELAASIAGTNSNLCPIPVCPTIFFPGEVLRCCIDCERHEVISRDNSFDIIYSIVLQPTGQIIRNRQTIFIPTFPTDFRRFFLSRAGEPGLKCQIEVFAQCTNCFVSGRDVTTNAITSVDCCFVFTIIGKLFSEVELLIPAYGYCPLPPECAPPLAVCPTIIPTGIPFPPETI